MSVENLNADYVVKYDGTSYSALDQILNSGILAFDVLQGVLYMGGAFTDVGGDGTADYMVAYDGTTTTNPGFGLNGTVRDTYVFNNRLYVGGDLHRCGY